MSRKRPARSLRPVLLLAVLGLVACGPAPGAGETTPLPETGPAALPQGVLLQYHFVAEDTPRVTSVTPAELEAHLDHLVEHDFTVLPLPELLERVRAGEALPPRSVAITFDDGYRSVYTNGFPLLRERDMPFTVFVNTAAHDAPGSQFATWAQLEEMQAAGATIANHSVSHAYLTRRPPSAPPETEAEFEARMAAEIGAAEDRITERLGVRHKLFAYPFGEYDARIQRWLAEHGYVGIGQHSGVVWSGSDFTALPRFPLSGSYADLDDFADKMRMHPLPVLNATSLADPTIATAQPQPELELRIATEGLRAGNLACYATGQGRIESRTEAAGDGAVRVSARAGEPLRFGRTRYNCTAPLTDGGWAWFSQPWLRLQPDGSAPP
jgi:peptidoglycan/xylan/chitin deacetylase (PgdA/CDA1 family)